MKKNIMVHRKKWIVATKIFINYGYSRMWSAKSFSLLPFVQPRVPPLLQSLGSKVRRKKKSEA